MYKEQPTAFVSGWKKLKKRQELRYVVKVLFREEDTELVKKK